MDSATQAAYVGPRCESQTFQKMAAFLEAFVKPERKGKLQAKDLNHYRDTYVHRSDDMFQVYRLLCPYADNHRGNYQLKEAALMRKVLSAAGVTEGSPHYVACMNWRTHSRSKDLGNFVQTLHTEIFVNFCESKLVSTLTLGELNAKLDELVAAASERKAPCATAAVRGGGRGRGRGGGRGDEDPQVTILRWLMQSCSATQMKWITRIILKTEMKLGRGIEYFLTDLHPDGAELYKTINDLATVCEQLRDREKRIVKSGLQLGFLASPQLAAMSSGPDDAFNRMPKGRGFVMECKFDGERVQLHKQGDRVCYFSRRGHDHGPK
ncbi:hypothetical protein FOA52_013863 [Chlamydomonas sp. UWO 241]|nr:hypothetical protein FOA52_013863 [Chlamydomonas sp. UWO 241]